MSSERRAEAMARRIAEFNQRVTDWEDHMMRLCAFWSSVLLASGAYGGSPMQKHVKLPVDGRHFDLWLRLFYQTLQEVCPPDAARLFMERALRIAESLEMAIAVEHGVMLDKGERLRRPDADVFLPTE
jgi:hemoglobin